MATVANAISGPYTWYYNTLPLGLVEDAPTMRFESSMEPITGDNLADTIQGIINRGGNMFLDFVFQEWNAAAAKEAFWPFSADQGQLDVTGVRAIGCQLSGKLLVGQAVDTTGSCTSPLRVYALNAVLAPNFNVAYLMGSRLRNVPVSMLLMPWVDVDPGGGSQAPVTDPTAAVTHVDNDNSLKLWAGGTIPGP